MTETEKLLEKLYDAFRSHFEPQPTEVKSKRFKPKIGERYCFISTCGELNFSTWYNTCFDNHRHATGNCYPYTDEGKEQAIWEQVTRKKYEEKLWEAADWVEGDYYCCFFDKHRNELFVKNVDKTAKMDKPRFATEQSAIDAHTRILGDDAERYFSRGLL